MRGLGAVVLERRREPLIKTHFFAVRRANEVRFAADQTFGSRQPNEIFGRFDLRFEMFVLRFDMVECFLRGMWIAVANESGVRFSNVIQQVIDGLLE